MRSPLARCSDPVVSFPPVVPAPGYSAPSYSSCLHERPPPVPPSEPPGWDPRYYAIISSIIL